MNRERVANNLYIFQSDVYAQVTSGVVAGPDMAVVIDTLALPEESRAIRDFVENELQLPIRYVINTHYHADHAWGNIFFPGAIVIGHELCRKFLLEKGVPSLKEEQKHNPVFRKTKILLPHITFEDGNLSIKIGKKTLSVFPLPGHTADSIAVLVKEDRVLYSGDAIMPIPYLVDGNIDDMITSLKSVAKMGLENIVQGHGDIILRGEIERTVKENLKYLSEIRKVVRKAGRRKYPLDLLETVTVEDCGKSRVLIGGLAEELHQSNLAALYKHFYGKSPEGSEEYFEE